MCENGEEALLCEFPMHGLHNEFIQCLEFKAKHATAESEQNYHKLLYSYFSARGDYRTGICIFLNLI